MEAVICGVTIKTLREARKQGITITDPTPMKGWPKPDGTD
jgi:hypothetical protein